MSFESNNEELLYTIAVISENSPGVLHRVTAVFTRRKINIDSLSVAETGVLGISRFTIVVRVTSETAKKLEGQLHKIIEVAEAHAFIDESVLSRQLAFFRILPSSSELNRTEIIEKVRKIITDHGGVITFDENDSIVFYKVGRDREIVALYNLLDPYGLEEFVRSGRIAMGRTHALTASPKRFL
jgi:acetolactate synthase I/III small subunit